MRKGKEKELDYIPETCTCCSQTTTYALTLDRGSVEILKKLARYIGRKGENVVCPRKEKECGLTQNEICNLIRPRSHGLIAPYKDLPGHFVLTRKGAQFLHGKEIPKTAIRSKVENRTLGYWKEEEDKCTIADFDNGSTYWEGMQYDIVNEIVVPFAVPSSTQPTLFAI
ncbi:MAG: hypothetical protein V4478_03230 [Patescibacteria group bacterium]